MKYSGFINFIFCLAFMAGAGLVSPALAGPANPAAGSLVSQKSTPLPGFIRVSTGATGRNVIEVRYPGGLFRNTGGRNWVETNRNGTYRFRETHRDDWSVYLFDNSRGVYIQLDLHRREIFYNRQGQPRQVLYRISGANARYIRPRAQPRPTPARNNTCDIYRNQVSRRSDIPVKVTFVNRSGGYRSVMWIGFNGQPKQYANLNPGQSFTINTFETHPWMFTDGPGNCLEMYMPRRGLSRFTLTAPNRNFGPE